MHSSQRRLDIGSKREETLDTSHGHNYIEDKERRVLLKHIRRPEEERYKKFKEQLWEHLSNSFNLKET